MKSLYFGLTVILLATSSVGWMTAVAQSNTMSEQAQHGKMLVSATKLRLPDNVGNGLNCSNCHFDAGTRAMSSPWLGIAGKFPEYSARHGGTITLQQRINDCFQRSMNGKALDENSVAMRDIMAYMRWLSDGNVTATRGFGVIDKTLQADKIRGRQIYAQRCASCHGADGEGIRADQAYAVPPLWGTDSFNDGSGMTRTYVAAAFVKHNMPLGQENSLSDQEAIDVAAFFTQQPRPVFAGKSNDWPKGGKPSDAHN